ncbi:MAG: MFS transporter [Acidipropionibacterium sp.]|nr:MFS transporter [Acidipropionibacterium sp.]
MTPTPPAEAVRARVGTLLIFLVNGMTFASLVPRYPEIKARLAASQTIWGLAVGLGPLGGLALGLAAARLMARFGSRNIAVWPQLASTGCLILVANAPHIAWIFVAMILMSALDAVTDTSMNYQGLRVQQLYRRSIINTFHGWWSVGAVAGGLIGSAMAQWRVGINLQAIVTIVILAMVCWLSWSLMLPGRDAGTRDADQRSTGLQDTDQLNADRRDATPQTVHPESRRDERRPTPDPDAHLGENHRPRRGRRDRGRHRDRRIELGPVVHGFGLLGDAIRRRSRIRRADGGRDRRTPDRRPHRQSLRSGRRRRPGSRGLSDRNGDLDRLAHPGHRDPRLHRPRAGASPPSFRWRWTSRIVFRGSPAGSGSR